MSQIVNLQQSLNQADEPKPSLIQRFFGAIPCGLWKIYLCCIVVIQVLNICVAPFATFKKHWALTFFNPFLWVLAGAVCLFLTLGLPRFRRFSIKKLSCAHKTFTIVVVLGCVLLFLYQMFFYWQAAFKGFDWDSPLMLYDIEEQQLRNGYYSRYPNNMLLGGIFMLFKHIDNLTGLNYIDIATVVSCLSVTLAVGLTAFIAKALGGTTAGFAAFAVGFILDGMSPWVLIPYSDTYSIFLTTLILFCYVCLKNPYIKWPTIAFLTFFGLSMKPTIVAPLGAIMLVGFCTFIARPHAFKKIRTQAKSLVEIAVFTLLALVLAFGITTALKQLLNIERNPEWEITPTHYLMMGANPEGEGVFNGEDRNLSFSIPTKEGRIEANLKVWAHRVQTLGPLGLAELGIKKALNTYGCGDFDWSPASQTLTAEVFGQNQPLKDFYGIFPYLNAKVSDQTFPAPYTFIVQAIWLGVLTGVALLLLRKKPSKQMIVIAVTLLLLGTFLLFSESNPRYLFLYSPYFVLLGTLGWQTLARSSSCTTRITP